MIDKAMLALDWIKDLKAFAGSGLFKIMSGLLRLAGPVAIAALIAFAAKETVEAIGQKQIDTAKDLLERNKNRESLTEDEKIILDAEIKAAGGLKKLNQVMETANDIPIEQRQIEARPDTTGGKNAQRAKKWDMNFGATHNPDGTPKSLGYVSDAEQIASMNRASNDTSVNDAEMKKLQRQNVTTPPPPAATPPASAAVSSMST
jgi:hypothetical protein